MTARRSHEIHHLLETITDLRQVMDERSRSASEIATWLVGLSFVAIGLVVSAPQVFGARGLYSQNMVIAAVIGFVVCVLAGIVQRVLFVGYHTALDLHLRGLKSFMTARFMSQDETRDSVRLLDREDLIARLSDEFGVSLTAEEREHSLEDLRILYEEVAGVRERHESEEFRESLSVLSCYLGHDLRGIADAADSDEGYNDHLARARHTYEMLCHDYSVVLFTQRVAQVAFISGVGAIGLAVVLWLKDR